MMNRQDDDTAIRPHPEVPKIDVIPGTRYRIECELGRGGMGTVYLAEDLKHRRKVAIKVIAGNLPVALGADRFLREIETVAKLVHPHILPLHDSGNAAGQLFYVTPYIEGESLRQRLNHEGRLPLTEALGIFAEVADALDYAHESGIVHRDIKPDNILLSRGHALVADFGLASVFNEPRATNLTQSGFIVGTPAYMSPEQACGETTVGPSSDIYALGCVLYEMLAGTPPFTGQSAQELIAKRLTDPVPSVRRHRTEVPSRIESALRRALSRDPGARFESARDFAAAVRGPGDDDGGRGQRSILVLPFANLSPDRENEYFGDGLTDELINTFGQVSDLRVISRTSAMRLKATDKDIPTIGRELDVRYVLEGSVRKAGTELRITARLVDAITDAPLWSEKFSGTVDDVFVFQEHVAQAIVQALQVRLRPSEETNFYSLPFADLAAYDCYLRARHELNRWSSTGVECSIRLLQDGLSLDADNALLLATKGYAHVMSVKMRHAANESEELAAAENCLRRLLELDADTPYAAFLRATISFERGDMRNAIRGFRACVDRIPSHAEAVFMLSLCFIYVGRSADAHLYAQRLIRLDPLTPLNRLLPVTIEAFDGRFDEVIRTGNAIYETDRENPDMAWTYGLLLALAGDFTAFEAVVHDLGELAPDWVYTHQLQALAAALKGDFERGRRHITTELEHASERDAHLSFHLSESYCALGAIEEALAFLQRAVHHGFVHYPLISRHDPLVARLRADSRFADLIAYVRSEWESLAVV